MHTGLIERARALSLARSNVRRSNAERRLHCGAWLAQVADTD